MPNRPYQNKLIMDIDAAMEEHRSILAVLPTGGGKTHVMGSMACDIIESGSSAWFTVHRDFLVDQISDKFHELGVPHGIIKAGVPPTKAPIQIAMVQTLRNCMSRLEPPANYFTDECHHTPASQYKYIMDALPKDTYRFGFTATPCRLDGKGLNDFYTTMVEGPQIPDLIGMGALVQPVSYGPKLVDLSEIKSRFGDFDQKEAARLMDRPSITGDCIEHYLRLAPGMAAAVFCQGIQHAKNVAAQFNKAGIKAECIYGELGRDDRAAILHRFKTKQTLILTSSDLLGEGFDCPGIEAVILLRPTESLSLYLQQVGRGLRPMPGKDKCIIIDHVDNIRGRHGRPEIPRAWSLFGIDRKKRQKDADDIQVTVCSVCSYCYEGRNCPYCLCEEMKKGKPREALEVKRGELEQIEVHKTWLTDAELEHCWTLKTRDEFEQYAVTLKMSFDQVKTVLLKKADTYQKLVWFGRIMNYSPGWAKHRQEAREPKPRPDNGQLKIRTAM